MACHAAHPETLIPQTLMMLINSLQHDRGRDRTVVTQW
jgi:hypothetical protein